MDKETDNQPQDESGDIEYSPAWPQRPTSGGQAARSGLDPTGSPRAKGSQQSDDAAWTSHPTSYDVSPTNDSKVTRELPVVDRSRFDGGRQPQQATRVQPPQSPPQPQRQS